MSEVVIQGSLKKIRSGGFGANRRYFVLTKENNRFFFKYYKNEKIDGLPMLIVSLRLIKGAKLREGSTFIIVFRKQESDGGDGPRESEIDREALLSRDSLDMLGGEEAITVVDPNKKSPKAKKFDKDFYVLDGGSPERASQWVEAIKQALVAERATRGGEEKEDYDDTMPQKVEGALKKISNKKTKISNWAERYCVLANYKLKVYKEKLDREPVEEYNTNDVKLVGCLALKDDMSFYIQLQDQQNFIFLAENSDRRNFWVRSIAAWGVVIVNPEETPKLNRLDSFGGSSGELFQTRPRNLTTGDDIEDNNPLAALGLESADAMEALTIGTTESMDVLTVDEFELAGQQIRRATMEYDGIQDDAEPHVPSVDGVAECI